MSIERYWETPINTIEKFSKHIIEVDFIEYIPWSIRNPLIKIFWGAHSLFLPLMFLEKKEIISSGTTIIVFYPLCLIWAIYFFNFFLIYLPVANINSLYRYLKEKDLPPSHATLISILVAVGVATLLVFCGLIL